MREGGEMKIRGENKEGIEREGRKIGREEGIGRRRVREMSRSKDRKGQALIR